MDPSNYEKLTPAEAVAFQRDLAQKINLDPFEGVINSIAGADNSYIKSGNDIYSGIVVYGYPELKIINRVGSRVYSKFPYLPGLLAFREIPGLIKAFNLLNSPPDVLMVDGQGIAHPRRMGIATHLGILLDLPTIGIAKSRLFGKYDEPLNIPGAYTVLKDRNEQIGWVYRSKVNCKPLFVSPGHKLSMAQCLEILQPFIRKYRLPEPIRASHHWVNQLRKSESITAIQTRLFH